MKAYIEERVLDVARHTIETKSTIRQTAKVYGCGRNTIHLDLTIRLKLLNPVLSNRVKAILDCHKSERHIRGGNANRERHKNKFI